MTPHLRKVGAVVTALSLVAVGLATLAPQTSTASLPHYCLICGSYGTVDALLNVALFIPLGFGLALIGVSPAVVALAVFLLSGSIELTQLIAIPGRDATIGDVLFNTLGGMCGFAIAVARSSLFRPKPRIALRLAIAWSLLWLVLQVVLNFGFRPALPHTTYYGQVAPKLGGFAVFKGPVGPISIGTIAISDGKLSASDSVRRALLHGEPLMVRIVPQGAPPTIAPIIRIADSNREEVLLLAQRDSDLIYTIRTGATSLRLRRPFFLSRYALQPQGSRDVNSVVTVARFGKAHLSLDTQTATADNAAHFSPNATYGWVLLLPFQWFIAGTQTERAVGWLWMAGLLLPFGFWLAVMMATGGWSRRLRRAIAAAASLIVGLAIVPAAVGAGQVDFLGWAAAFAGVIIGAVFAAFVTRTGAP